MQEAAHHFLHLAFGCAAVADYVTRTAGKAEIWHELKAQGAEYADVADALLSLAQDRAQNRP